MGAAGAAARAAAAVACLAAMAWFALEFATDVHFHPVADGVQRACAVGNW